MKNLKKIALAYVYNTAHYTFVKYVFTCTGMMSTGRGQPLYTTQAHFLKVPPG